MTGRCIVAGMVFCIASAACCIGQPITIIRNEGFRMNDVQPVGILRDTFKIVSINNIMQKPYVNEFLEKKGKFYTLGTVTYPVWCRFKIKNETDQKLVLVVNNAQLEWLELYFMKEDKLYHKSISVYHAFQKREIASNQACFLLDIPTDSVQTYYLRLQTNSGLKFPLQICSMKVLIGKEHIDSIFNGIYLGIMLVMMLYNFFIYFSTKDRSYLMYVLYVAFMTLTNMNVKGLGFEFFWPSIPILNQYVNIAGCLTGIFAILFALSFLHISQYARFLKSPLMAFILLYLITIIIILFRQRFVGFILTEIISVLVALILLVAGIIVYNKGYRPAKFYLIAWTFLLISVIIFLSKDYNILPYNVFTVNSMVIGSAFEAVLLSFALADRINNYRNEKENAQQKMLLSMEENKKLILEQNITLEKKVAERTSELKTSNRELTETLQNLKSTQSQLIQSEKMASLGEVTAGIAHEIQNPLNFVNNFSEVNTELVDELQSELKAGNTEAAIAISSDIKENEEKINHHGKRADAIVKNMLQHSRTSTGQKEPTDINALADEYLRLSYHGMRAKDKTFNANMQTDFDASIGKINVIPQDIGRVLLNLFNNAFYAVNEKAKQQTAGYEPVVSVISKKINNIIELAVKDNGNGIPKTISDKIFQPFFTTKPTGQGTGLGLSLSYDIIKAHGGEIKVEAQEGLGSTFVIRLPLNGLQ